MKKTALIFVAVIFLIASFTTVTVAGVDPQPFHQISALSLDVKIHGKQLNKMLLMPTCDSSPGEIRQAVVDFHKIGIRLAGFDESVSGVWGSYFSYPEDDDWGDSAIQLKSRVKSIIRNIDEFMGVPPDTCVAHCYTCHIN